MAEFVTLERYVVRRTTDKAVGLAKDGSRFGTEIAWVPRSCCFDGDALENGDTDLTVHRWKADELGLDYFD